MCSSVRDIDRFLKRADTAPDIDTEIPYFNKNIFIGSDRNSEEFNENSDEFNQNSEEFNETSEKFNQNSEETDKNAEEFNNNSEKLDNNSEEFNNNSEKLNNNSEEFINYSENLDNNSEFFTPCYRSFPNACLYLIQLSSSKFIYYINTNHSIP